MLDGKWPCTLVLFPLKSCSREEEGSCDLIRRFNYEYWTYFCLSEVALLGIIEYVDDFVKTQVVQEQILS